MVIEDARPMAGKTVLIRMREGLVLDTQVPLAA